MKTNMYQEEENELPQDEKCIAFKKNRGIIVTARNMFKTDDIIDFYINENKIRNKINIPKEKLMSICDDIRYKEEKMLQIDIHMKYDLPSIYILDIQIDGKSFDYIKIFSYIKKYNFNKQEIIKIGKYKDLLKIEEDCIIYSINPIKSIDNRYIRRYIIDEKIDIWEKNENKNV